MNKRKKEQLENIYPICHALLGAQAWDMILTLIDQFMALQCFEEQLLQIKNRIPIPDYLPSVSHLEWIRYQVSSRRFDHGKNLKQIQVNPTLEVIQLSWKITPLFSSSPNNVQIIPKQENEWGLVWKNPKNQSIHVEAADDSILLALKLTVEGLSPKLLAKEKDVPLYKLNEAIQSAVDKGILISPRSQIQREPIQSSKQSKTFNRFVTVNQFTIQWHITHKCDLHCKHCYDRSRRSPLSLKQGRDVLDQLDTFCQKNYVRGHVCFTGGNPFLYPHFFNLVQIAVGKGFSISVLGNPVPRPLIEKFIEIRKPDYFQVSLEGLPKHNDTIRGHGNFFKVIEFLGVLRDLHVTSAVMLTLTEANIDQVLTLAERLRGHTDHFTFNRLSQVGEGANLGLPGKESFIKFLKNYVEASKKNSILGLKDNLINIIRFQKGEPPFGGCTGFGCGAAFNFLAILPDGDVHACRKFPSKIGNIFEESLEILYSSQRAADYRSGSESCKNCHLRIVCGGCMAIVYGSGGHIFKDRDPYCFIESLKQS